MSTLRLCMVEGTELELPVHQYLGHRYSCDLPRTSRDLDIAEVRLIGPGPQVRFILQHFCIQETEAGKFAVSAFDSGEGVRWNLEYYATELHGRRLGYTAATFQWDHKRQEMVGN